MHLDLGERMFGRFNLLYHDETCRRAKVGVSGNVPPNFYEALARKTHALLWEILWNCKTLAFNQTLACSLLLYH